jgi:hypothetical protein
MLFEQNHPPKAGSFSNTEIAVMTTDTLNKAMELMRNCVSMGMEYMTKPTVRVVPPELHLIERKYWIPYGNTAVPVNEEIEYKFIHRLQGYLRNKNQNVDSPRLIKV